MDCSLKSSPEWNCGDALSIGASLMLELLLLLMVASIGVLFDSFEIIFGSTIGLDVGSFGNKRFSSRGVMPE